MELIKEIWSSAKRNKLRTTLTGFAVAWGIFMIIFLLGAGNGLINAQVEEQNRHVKNSMKIYGGQTSKAYNGLKEGRWISLQDKDISTTKNSFLDNVDLVGGEIRESSGHAISYGENYVSPTITGVAPEYKQIEKYEILHGRFINALDMQEQRKVIVISKRIAKELDRSYERLLGKYVKVDNFAFKVVGIYKEDESE